MRAQHFFRWITLFFAMTLGCIILAANLNIAPELFDIVYRFPNGDKLAHFLLLGTLSLLVSLSFRSVRWLGLLTSVIALCALMTLEEFSQIFLDSRRFSVRDLAANYAGIFLFGELGAALKRVLNQKRN